MATAEAAAAREDGMAYLPVVPKVIAFEAINIS